jgi:hypothetical protein
MPISRHLQAHFCVCTLLARPLIVISIHLFTITDLPDQPQNFNLTDDHHLSLSLAPLMPVAQPYRWRTGRRRALIVRGRNTPTI